MVVLDSTKFDPRRELDIRHEGDRDEVNTTEVNTFRFWLMLKMKQKWDKRYDIYLSGLTNRILEAMTSGSDQEKRHEAASIINKLYTKAWGTMPADFLKKMGVDPIIGRRSRGH